MGEVEDARQGLIKKISPDHVCRRDKHQQHQNNAGDVRHKSNDAIRGAGETVIFKGHRLFFQIIAQNCPVRNAFLFKGPDPTINDLLKAGHPLLALVCVD